MSSNNGEVSIAPEGLTRRSVLQGGALAVGHLLTGSRAALGFLQQPAGTEQPEEPDLRCEFLNEPLGLQLEQPRLSWTGISESPAPQQSYEIEFASARGGPADLWSTGRVSQRMLRHGMEESACRHMRRCSGA